MRALARRITLIVVAVVALLMAAAPATAQVTGQTDISIDFPPLIILYYYSDVTVTISASDLAGFVISGWDGTSAIDQGSQTGSGFEPDLTVPTATDGSLSAALLALRNMWGIRAVGDNGDITVSTALVTGSETLTGSNGGTITMGDTIGLRLSGDTGAGVTPVDFTPQGLGTVQFGDVVIPLNLQDAAQGGLYQGGQFTISADYL